MNNPEHADRSKDQDKLDRAQKIASGEEMTNFSAEAPPQEGDTCTTSDGRSGYVTASGNKFICVPND